MSAGFALEVAAAAVVGIVSWRAYRESGNRGFLVLAVLFGLWPVLGAPLWDVVQDALIERATGSERWSRGQVVALLSLPRVAVYFALLTYAVITLRREIEGRDAVPGPVRRVATPLREPPTPRPR